MGFERRTVIIEGGVQWFRPCVRPGGRRGSYIWFENEEVPGLLGGQSAKFEIERERKKGAKWRVVRRLDG